jgi:uncharacterized protein YprB with RNaseH-like and TPR domain
MTAKQIHRSTRKIKPVVMEKQLNVWIDGDIKDALANRAQREGKSLKELIEGILRQDVVRQNGERIELPLIREMIAAEVEKAAMELHSELLKEIDILLRRHIDRLAKHVVRIAHDIGISRQLQTAHLSKAYGLAFAKEAYEHAEAGVRKELPFRSTILLEQQKRPIKEKT